MPCRASLPLRKTGPVALAQPELSFGSAPPIGRRSDFVSHGFACHGAHKREMQSDIEPVVWCQYDHFLDTWATNFPLHFLDLLRRQLLLGHGIPCPRAQRAGLTRPSAEKRGSAHLHLRQRMRSRCGRHPQPSAETLDKLPCGRSLYRSSSVHRDGGAMEDESGVRLQGDF